jgi:hypothetical protein
MFEKKSDIVRRLGSSGHYQKALRVAKDFRLGISKEDSDAMKLGWNCVQSPDFYAQLNVNVNTAITIAITVLCGLYGGAAAK